MTAQKTIILLLAVSLSASAALVNCPVGTPDSASLGGSISPPFSCGGLTFSNFKVDAADGGAIGTLDINGAEFNSTTGEVDIQFNPNLMKSQDEWVTYKVTGGCSAAGPVGGRHGRGDRGDCLLVPDTQNRADCVPMPGEFAREGLGLQQRSD